MVKQQCWEIEACGKEGVCTAGLPSEFSGVNNGKHAGRFCWALAGTIGDGDSSCTYSSKIGNCLSCDVLQKIEKEEGAGFILTPQHFVAMRDLYDNT